MVPGMCPQANGLPPAKEGWVTRMQRQLLETPLSVTAWMQWLQWLQASGDREGLLSASRQALQHFPLQVNILAHAAHAAAELQQTALAVRYYRRLVKLRPQQPNYHFGLALAYEQQPDAWDLAARHYQQVIALDPKYVAAYHNLGYGYLQAGQYEAAEALFLQLQRQLPSYAKAWLGVAMAWDYAGKVRLAQAAYRRYLRRQPQGEQVPFVRRRLAELARERRGNRRLATL